MGEMKNMIKLLKCFKGEQNAVICSPFQSLDICIIMDRGTAFETYKKIFESMGIPLSIYADFKLNNEYDIITLENILRIIIKIKNKT